MGCPPLPNFVSNERKEIKGYEFKNRIKILSVFKIFLKRLPVGI